jgi:predicted aconitase
LLLSGASGDGAALAMRLVVRAADALGAARLIPITRAHVDSCLYHGEATIDFVERLVDGGARVGVPTTLNVGALDLLHPELWHGDPRAAERGRLLMTYYRTLGCEPTYTCAPYQLPSARPAFGEQVAWGESNAIAFCNSVIGARTERYGDFTDIACAIAGRVPDAGLHRTEARRATLVLRLGPEVPPVLLADDSVYPVLGIVLGRRAGSRVAVIDGLPANVSEDRLKAVGAAAASSGAVAMFHAVGSTPEAPTLAAALQGGEPEGSELIELPELRAARDELTTAREGGAGGTPIGTVSLGTPHASLAELRAVERELGGDRAAAGVELLVSMARDLLAEAEVDGLAGRLRAAGVELLVDTCSYIAPVLRSSSLPAMTDSGKWAYYAPGNIGVDVVFGSLRECVRSAVEGRVWRDADLWGSA